MHTVYLQFPVAGIQLMDGKHFCNETLCRVSLSLLGIKSSGLYRCEVSGDAPHFKLTASAANMSVAALPQNNPLISSFHSAYRFDEFVNANCTTDFSSLPAQLSWFINGEKANFADLHPAIETTIPAHEYNLRRQTLQLQFYANDPRFQRNDVGTAAGQLLELLCVAEITNYPKLRRETKLNAILMYDEDLKNQKLVNNGTGTPHSSLLLLLFMTLSTFAVTQKALQYGAHRKSMHFKTTDVAAYHAR